MAVTHYRIDHTHEASLRSWVRSANDHPDFPIQNLPFCAFRAEGEQRLGVAIGDRIVDLAATRDAGLLDAAPDAHAALDAPELNDVMALSLAARDRLRHALSRMLGADTPEGSAAQHDAVLVSQEDVELVLPARIGDYTDFYASIFHATNVGRMFRPDNPLLPNYTWIPIGYHGRASSIVPSGTPVQRPSGQTRDDASPAPTFGPSKRLDYELEVGLFAGTGNALGSPIAIGEAEAHLFGICLLNDWSARDIQTWEYQPLGPFLAKNFATSISPWVVTMEALAPFRTAPLKRREGEPAPLPYLTDAGDQAQGALAVTLEVLLSTAAMRSHGMPPASISRSSLADLYWTPAQILTHHASNGCNLQPGDLLGTGTVSGEAREARGCLLELTWRGSEPLTLPSGQVRRFLEDGDDVIMRGWCEREGFQRIGLGECRGTVIG
jgi:fumarylacetoacetase